MTILLNANIYSDTVFNISTGFCRRAYQKGAPPLPAAPPIQSLCLIVDTMVGLNPTKH